MPRDSKGSRKTGQYPMNAYLTPIREIISIANGLALIGEQDDIDDWTIPHDRP